MANRHNLIQNPAAKKRDSSSLLQVENLKSQATSSTLPSSHPLFNFQHSIKNNSISLPNMLEYQTKTPIGIPVGPPQTVKIPPTHPPTHPVFEVIPEETSPEKMKEDDIIKIDTMDAESIPKSDFSDFERDRYA